MNFLRRGSKKNLVKTIHIVSERNSVTDRIMSGEDLNLHQPEINFGDITTLRDNLEKTQNEIERLRRENEQLEIARNLTEDQANYFENLLKEKEAEILSLSVRIETLTLKNEELEENHNGQLYEAKTQYVNNLEAELKRTKEESAKAVARLQGKVKKVQETHVKSKQEYALKVFALKDENNKLQEENKALQGRYLSRSCTRRPGQEPEISDAHVGDDVTSDPRSKLIVQLSQQVTSLDVENHELRKELEKAKRLLARSRLKQSQRTGEIGTEPRHKYERELCINLASLDVGNSSSEIELLG